MKFVCSILFLTFICNFAYCQTVTGKVSYEDCNYPASGVKVRSNIDETITDSGGDYCIKVDSFTKVLNFEAGDGFIRFFYDDLSIDIERIKNDTLIDITLEKERIELAKQSITAYVTPSRRFYTVDSIVSKRRRKRIVHYFDRYDRMVESKLIKVEMQGNLFNNHLDTLCCTYDEIYNNDSLHCWRKWWLRRVEGIVWLVLEVDAEGNWTFEIPRSPDPALSIDALRILNSIPDWLIDIKNHINQIEYYYSLSKACAVNYSFAFILPINFHVEYVKN